MTLYKHLVYVNFVSFIRQSWNCYLEDIWEFFPTLDLAQSNPWIGYTLKEELCFSSRTGSPPYYMEMLVFKHIQNRFYFRKQKISCTKDWFLSICRHGNSTWIFLDPSWKFYFFFKWPLEFQHALSLIILGNSMSATPPRPPPPGLDFFLK